MCTFAARLQFDICKTGSFWVSHGGLQRLIHVDVLLDVEISWLLVQEWRLTGGIGETRKRHLRHNGSNCLNATPVHSSVLVLMLLASCMQIHSKLPVQDGNCTSSKTGLPNCFALVGEVFWTLARNKAAALCG